MAQLNAKAINELHIEDGVLTRRSTSHRPSGHRRAHALVSFAPPIYSFDRGVDSVELKNPLPRPSLNSSFKKYTSMQSGILDLEVKVALQFY